MTREFVVSLLAANRHLEFFVIILTSLMPTAFILKAGLIWIKAKYSPAWYFVAVFFLSLYVIMNRLFLPPVIMPFISILIASSAIALLGQKNFLRCLWVGFIIIGASFIIDIIPMIILMKNEKALFFLTKNPYGVMIGIVFEALVPMLTVVFLKLKRREPIILMIKNKEIIYCLVAFGAILYQIYDGIMKFFEDSLRFGDLMSVVISSTVAICGFLALFHSMKKRYQRELKKGHLTLINPNKVVKDTLQKFIHKKSSLARAASTIIDYFEE